MNELNSFDRGDVISRATATTIVKIVNLIKQNLIDNLIASKKIEHPPETCCICGEELPENYVARCFHEEKHKPRVAKPLPRHRQQVRRRRETQLQHVSVGTSTRSLSTQKKEVAVPLQQTFGDQVDSDHEFDPSDFDPGYSIDSDGNAHF